MLINLKKKNTKNGFAKETVQMKHNASIIQTFITQYLALNQNVRYLNRYLSYLSTLVPQTLTPL